MPVNRFITTPNKPRAQMGDAFFKGFRSRPYSANLPEGVAAYMENLRVDRNVARVRAGSVALSNDIQLAGAPLVVPFTLATDVAVSSITRSGGTATVTTSANHGYTTNDRVNIRGADQADYNGDYTITVTGVNTFTYTVANSPATPATGTIFANDGLRVYDVYDQRVWASCTYATATAEGVVMAAGTSAWAYVAGTGTVEINYPGNEQIKTGDICDMVQYLEKVYLFRGRKLANEVTISSMTSSSTTATCTTSGNHGLATGDYVDIRGVNPNGYNGIVAVTVTGATTFTYTVASGLTTPATVTGATIMQVKPPLSWDMNTANDFVVVTGGPNAAGGTIRRMPAADWGEHFLQRMVLPYSRDELLLSDALDPNSYDTAYSQLRIEPGTQDYLVGVHPYQEYQLLVLYRRSLHLLLLNDNLGLSRVSTLTRDIGCVARKSVVTAGSRIVWLSDQGVHYLDIGDTVSLRNNTTPLSDPIQDVIDTINWEYADQAAAAYYNNRYYLAVPTGSATTNNTVLVYNFLNSEWESVDVYPGSFDVQEWHKLDYDGQQRLHACTTYGFLLLMEEGAVDEYGAPGSTATTTIAGELTTRDYRLGLGRGRFHRLQIIGDVDSGDALAAAFSTSDPDATFTNVIQYTATSSTDVSLRRSLHGRGQSGRVAITTSAGRPEIRSVMVEAVNSDRNLVNAS